MVDSTATASEYPILIFLHSHLADPTHLQRILQLPKTPKLRKARLVGYTASELDDSAAVSVSSYGFGEWAGEEEVQGVVYEVESWEQEERISAAVCRRGDVGEGVKGRWEQVRIKACSGRNVLLGMRTVWGKAFVSDSVRDDTIGQESASPVQRIEDEGGALEDTQQVIEGGRSPEYMVGTPGLLLPTGQADESIGLEEALRSHAPEDPVQEPTSTPTEPVSRTNTAGTTPAKRPTIWRKLTEKSTASRKQKGRDGSPRPTIAVHGSQEAGDESPRLRVFDNSTSFTQSSQTAGAGSEIELLDLEDALALAPPLPPSASPAPRMSMWRSISSPFG